MRPVVSDVKPLSDDTLREVERRLKVTLTERVREILRANNAGKPTPRWVEFAIPLIDDSTTVVLYEFANVCARRERMTRGNDLSFRAKQ